MSMRISDLDHVVRVCKNKHLIFEDGVPVGVHADHFKLRRATPDRPQETYLSCVHFEAFPGEGWARFKAARDGIPYEVGAKAGLSKLSAGGIRECGRNHGRTLRVERKHNRSCAQYSAIYGIRIDDESLAVALAECAVAELVMSIDLDGLCGRRH